MAWQSGLAGDRALYRDHIKPAADFLVAHGPSFGVERWEEQGGYSPSTIAAEIAGLVAAGADRRRQRRRRLAPASTRPPPTTSSARSRAGRSPPPGRTRPGGTSSGCRRTATRTRRSATTSATAAPTPTSARSSTPASRSWSGSASCRRTTRTCIASLPVVDDVDPDRRPPPAPASTATARPRPAPRTGTATASSPTRRTARPTASRGRPATPAPGTCGRCCPASGPSTQLPTGDRRRRAALLAAMNDSTSGVGTGARAGLGEPGPGRVAVRHRPDDRVDRLRQRPAGRLGLAADLGAGPAGAARSLDARRRPPARAARDRRRPVRRHGPPGTLPVTVTAPADGATVTDADGRRSPARRRRAPPSTSQSTATDTGGATSVVDRRGGPGRRVLGRPCRRRFGTDRDHRGGHDPATARATPGAR